MAERLLTMLRRLVSKDEAATAAEEEAKALRKLADEEEAAVWSELEEQGQTSGTWDLGERYGRVQFQRRSTPRATVLNKERAFESLRAEGLDDAIIAAPEPSIRQGALSDEVRGRLKRGEALPEGIGHTMKRYVTITRKPD